jgi:hypothetical protein
LSTSELWLGGRGLETACGGEGSESGTRFGCDNRRRASVAVVTDMKETEKERYSSGWHSSYRAEWESGLEDSTKQVGRGGSWW